LDCTIVIFHHGGIYNKGIEKASYLLQKSEMFKILLAFGSKDVKLATEQNRRNVMAMKFAPRGIRTSHVRITISKTTKRINLFVGFSKKHNLTKEYKKVFIGYDEDKKTIGLRFAKIADIDKDAFSIIWAKTRYASFSAVPLLNTFDLKPEDVAGTYENEALSGPITVSGFGDNVYLLDTNKRKRGK
jgi:hypothetical protein